MSDVPTASFTPNTGPRLVENAGGVPPGNIEASATASASAEPPPEGEPTSYHKDSAYWLGLAILLLSIAAGVGAGASLFAPSDGVLAGIFMPVVFAGAIFAGLATAGHQLLAAAPRVLTRTGRVGFFVTLAITMVIAIGSSSWGGASIISGPAAERAYQTDHLAKATEAFGASWTLAVGQGTLITCVKVASTELSSLSQNEATGGLTGKSGRGAATLLIATAAAGYREVADTAQIGFDDLKRQHTRGQDILDDMQKAVGKDPALFGKLAIEIQRISSAQSMFDVTPLIAQLGLINADVADAKSMERLKTAVGSVKTKVQSCTREVMGTRQAIVIPPWMPIEPRDAVIRYASSAAVGGWIVSIAIDVMPGALLLFFFLTAGEEKMLRLRRDPKATTRPDYDNHGRSKS